MRNITGEHWPIISNVAQGLPREFYRPGIFGFVSLLHFACLLHGLLFLTSTFLKKIQIKYLRDRETCQKLVDKIKLKREERRRQGI